MNVANKSKEDLEGAKSEIKDWSTTFQKTMEGKIAEGSGAAHSGGAGGGGRARLDKKEVQVWKLPEKSGKSGIQALD